VTRYLSGLVDIDEIARHIGDNSPSPVYHVDGTTLEVDLNGFLSAPTNSPAQDPALVGRGIRTAREVCDAAKRFKFAADHQQTFLSDIPAASLSELLSLHWTEGAFAVLPNRDSFSHAPLILALPDPVDFRTAGVKLSGTNPITHQPLVSRPGFVVCEDWQSSWTLQSAAMDLAMINAMTLGGFDNLFVWHPRSAGSQAGDDKQNEVYALFDYVYRKENLGPFNGDLTFTGYAIAELEQTESVSDPNAFVDAIRAKRQNYFDACAAEPVPDASNPVDAILISDAEASSTALMLELSASWYSSRRRIRTLFAWRDRADLSLNQPFLTPYLAYLRYHLGDIYFVRIVMQAVRGLRAIEQNWKQRLKTPSVAASYASANLDLRTLLQNSAWSSASDGDRSALMASASQWLQFWSNNRVKYHPGGSAPFFETAWRHHGLLDVIKANAPGAPGDFPSSADIGSELGPVADVVRDAVMQVDQWKLWPAIDAALQGTPIDALANAGVKSGGAIRNHAGLVHQLTAAEIFERRRLYYEASLVEAGVGPDGTIQP
jgi:hypothetical protein